MNLLLKRTQYRSDGVFGELYDASGNKIAVTLERAYPVTSRDPSRSYASKIPAGEYLCVRGQHRLSSMAHAFTTFEITGVSGHTDILFHAGNYNRDSEGCVLLGQRVASTVDGQMITKSRVTFAEFMELESSVDHFVLTVEDL
jgi:hypothetical protein